MSPASGRSWLSVLALSLLAVVSAKAGDAANFDPNHTQLGFELRTRWGQKLEGIFPRYEGHVRVLPDGQHQVQLRMYTRDVEIVGYPRYTEWARGEHFFQADRYPVVAFTSRPYSPQLLRTGGDLAGELSIRGISRPGSLTVLPSTCARPAVECDVVASGAVRRSDYEMDDWKLAINDRVVFRLRARVQDEARQ